MAIYLSTLFMSIVQGAVSCEACMNEDIAVMDALDLCNWNFIRRWDDADYQISPGENTNDELRAFYDVAREYNACIPFPLRVFVRKALIDAGDTKRATEWQLDGLNKIGMEI